MVKLIATDMDGTLLDEHKRLPEQFPQLLTALQACNVTFAIASGRSYAALAPLFGAWAEQMILICDNGGDIRIPGQEPIYQCMPLSVVHAILKFCETTQKAVPVMCCKGGIYYPSCASAAFREEVSHFYTDCCEMSYAELYHRREPVIKLALCALDGAASLYETLSVPFGAAYELVISGSLWMDVMHGQVSKGNAIAHLQKKLQITKAETMVFGDYQNDISMFLQADYSYAMEQASDIVKQQARFIAPSNTENGVIRTICDKLQLSL